MKNMMETVIAAGGYKLADMQYKIKKLYILGDLSEEEADALLTLAQGGVSADAERPGTLKLIQTLSDKITALEDRVKTLEGGEAGEHTGYPAWQSWDGISDHYQPGAIVTHNGKLWQSVYAGQNVWEPGTVGQQFWVTYEEA